MGLRTGAYRSALTRAIFFLSGSAGLIYEVVWSRLLKEVFGVTAYAIAVVLATYLGGLALGAWVLGPKVDRAPRPLRLYGQLEIATGVLAILGAPLLRFFEPIDRLAATHFAPDSLLLIGIRLAVSSLLILPPTVAMGATLPAMTKAMVPRLGRLSGELAFLYALNTAGAVVGCLVTGGILIRVIGVHPSLWLAAVLNFVVGGVAFALSRGEGEVVEQEALRVETPPAQTGLLVAVALGGVASLALEVIWTRVLVLVLGGSTYAFVTMLAVFLAGIALGSFILHLFVDRVREPRRAFGYLQAAIAISILATIPAMNALVTDSQIWLYRLELSWVQLLLARFGIAALIMIVPTTLIGMSFPLAARLHVGSVETMAGGLGRVYGANTLGNIAGAVLGGFVLLPIAGMHRGLVLLTALNLAAAAWGFWPRDRLGRWISGTAFGGAVVCVLAIVTVWKPPAFRSIEEEPFDRTLFYEEGLVSTVKVLQRATDGEQRVMLVDNVRIGQSSRGVDYKQQVLAHLPFLLAPRVERVLSIGLGTGIAAGEAARHPGVQVDCVELSPSVIEGAKQFASFNGDVLHDPKVRVIADDGFSFLKRSALRYDAIVSDGKSRLGETGNSTFFSDDFYRAASQHLSEDGTMLQWMPLNEEPQDLRTIVRTFMRSFRHSYLWMGQNSLFLAGRNAPLALDLDRIQDELDGPATEHLRRHGWRSATDVVAMMVADRNSAEPWLAGETTVNSLEKPVLEFYSMRRLATPSLERIAENVKALARTREETFRHLRLDERLGHALESSRRGFGLLMSALQLRARPGSAAEAAKLLMRASLTTPPDSAIRSYISIALADVAEEEESAGNVEAALADDRAAIGAFAGNVTARLSLAASLARMGQNDEAVEELRRVLVLNPQSQTAHEDLGLLLEHDDPQEAAQHLTAARDLAPEMPAAHHRLGRALDAAGRSGEALASFREASRLQPDWAAPTADAAMLIAMHPALGKPGEALQLAERANSLANHSNADILQVLAVAYSECGRHDDAADAQRKAIALLKNAGDTQAAARAADVLERYAGKRR